MKQKLKAILGSVLALFCLVCVLVTGAWTSSLDAQALSSMTVNRTGYRNASGYDFIVNADRLTFDRMTWSATGANWREVVWADDRYPVLYWHGTLPGNKTNNLGTVTCRFSDAVDAYDNQSYDLILTISNIKVKWPDYYNRNDEKIYRPILLRELNSGGVTVEARQVNRKVSSGTFTERVIGTTTTCNLNYKLVKHGTNTAVSGTMLLGFRDLDVWGSDNTFNGRPEDGQEGITIVSGGKGKSWVQSNTCLKILDNGATYVSTRSTTTDAEMDRSTVTFLANTTGTTVRWGGTTCSTNLALDMKGIFPQYTITPSKEGPGTITPSSKVTVNGGMSRSFTMKADANAQITQVLVDGKAVSVTNKTNMTYTFSNVRANHTIHVKFARNSYALNTQVRWQNKDGTWTNYQVVDSKTVTQGSPYSYTWVRDAIKSEPENIYKDGSPKTVGTSAVTGAATYSIDVARKQYTYSFDFRPPSGHSVSEIGNRQANLSDKYAETISGSVKSPTLTGYTFLGWNTKADGTGAAYESEAMLSNKIFYAQWKANQYVVHYDGNAGFNPDHKDGEFTQNIVTSESGMPDSTYQYDVAGTLRKNDFVREGYTFTGWNTKPDGSGTSYPDSYNKVLNWMSTDGGVITLYAQWKKTLGTETITVVSEETGKPVEGVFLTLYQNVDNQRDAEIVSQVTNEKGQITVNNLHWFEYTWECTDVPDGYHLLEDTWFTISYNKLSAENEKILYMKRVEVTLDSQVSNIIKGENAPAFLYLVSGTDAAGVDHSYSLLVQTDGKTKEGSNYLSGLFAGTYEIIQIPVSRYQPQTAVNVEHGTISGISASVDLLRYDRAEVLFPYTIQQYGGFGHTDAEINRLIKKEPI